MHFLGPVLHAVLGGGEYNFAFLKVFSHFNILTTDKLSDDMNSQSTDMGIKSEEVVKEIKKIYLSRVAA